MMFKLFLVVFVVFSHVGFLQGDEHTHFYKDNEEVVLWMNTVGPYHNRQETYSYFSLPFCVGPKEVIGHYHETLGEALQGFELEYSGLAIDFKSDTPATVFCEIELSEEKLKAFTYAVKNRYWYQMFIDDLPIWGVVGEADDTKGEYYVYSHKKFDMGSNGNQIVDVNMTTEGKVLLKAGEKISFSYEVNWKSSKVKYEDRFDKYLDPNFFQHRIHWFSIFNSFMMVIFLVGLVSMILMRTLRKDYARYAKDEEMDDMDRDLGDEYGWKQVHGDVFRPAAKPLFFSALLGTGYRLLVVTVAVILFTILGELYTERGSLLSTAIFVYAATSPINGYFGASIYAQMGGKKWIRQMLCSVFLLPSVVCGTSFLINFIAIYYHASRSIPFGSMVAVACIVLFVVLPLTLVGTVLGRNLGGQSDYPCRVNAIPRPIPEKKWYMEPPIIVALGGILPFGSIFIEMYFIFTSFWAYKIYYVYGFMLLVFLILLVVTVCVTIVCTYFLLNAEDYRWQWTSFFAAASTSGYVYLYSIYYFLFKTKMYGLFQTAFYFGHMALFSLGLGIMCGTVGYIGSSYFKWIRQMLCSVFLLPSVVCGTSFLINFIAIYYHASRSIPFGSMVAVACIVLFVVLPLTLVGTVLGRNLGGQSDYPCRVNAIPRPIPEKKWYMEPPIIVALGGILPFGSIFIEMYFIFTSFWAYKIYYVYGFMLLVFLILLVVTVCVTIVCTYFLLNAEDYRWQWTSFFAAASTSGYVYLYSIYYFLFKTKMYGLFQTAFYFGHMALFSLGLGIMCGTVGYIGSSYFVRKIYSTVKID